MTQKEAGGPPPPARLASGIQSRTTPPAPRSPDFAEVDRRAGSDRRHRPTPFWSAFSAHDDATGAVARARRIEPRRSIHAGGRYVLVVAILVLNVLDALFTLVWLQRGGSEGNP